MPKTKGGGGGDSERKLTIDVRKEDQNTKGLEEHLLKKLNDTKWCVIF